MHRLIRSHLACLAMKKPLLAALLFLLYGCANFGVNQSNSGICPETPETPLDSDNVEQVSLSSNTLTKSGQVSNGNSRGYTFDVKPGDELSFSTSDDVCIWIYGPDGALVDGSTLLQEGPHVLQVAARQGSTSYNIAMGVSVSGPVSSNDSSASGGTSSSGGSSASNNGSASGGSSSGDTSTGSSNSSNRATLTQTEAQTLVQRWLDSKSVVFGPPFNRNLVGQLTTGILYEDITKTNGSIDWLKNNGSRYVYSDSSIEDVWSYDSSNPDKPSMKVSIYEDRVLIKNNGRRDPSQSGASTNNFTYFFVKDDGVWKISDYVSSN